MIGGASAGRRMGTPLPSAVCTKISPSSFAGGIGEGCLKRVRLLRHLLVHVFQAVHVLLQPQDPLDGLGRLAKRFFHGEALVPILQQVREFACRQGQAGVDGRELDRLAFPLGVHIALNVDLPEDRHIRPRLRFVRPLDGGSIGELVLLAHVAVPEAIDQQL